MSSVKERVDAKIAHKKVMMFSKKYCGYCSMAKQTLEKYVGKELRPDDYEVWEIDDEEDCHELQAYLGKITGAQSVGTVLIVVLVNSIHIFITPIIIYIPSRPTSSLSRTI